MLNSERRSCNSDHKSCRSAWKGTVEQSPISDGCIVMTTVKLGGGDGQCLLYREVTPPSAKRKRSTLRDSFSVTIDSDLFDVLRDIRLRLARERGVPPYVIFHDTTLRDMVVRRPKTLDDLHEVYGVGAKKAADFGDAFLDAIRTFRRPE